MGLLGPPRALQVNPASGLSEDEAQTRLAQYGNNTLKEQPRPGFLRRLLDQFTNVIVLLLIGASVVSALLGEWYEAGAIILIVILNALLGVIQEGRAEQALAVLKKLAAPEAHLLRSGRVVSISAEEIAEAGMHLCATGGTCMVMGTASTMACIAARKISPERSSTGRSNSWGCMAFVEAIPIRPS